jgi:hypothetical protein
MPDHLHLIVEATSPAPIRWALATELRAFTRSHYPDTNLWTPVPEPRVIPNVLHLQRTIRYVHLNPCRAGITNDPLDWEWSTHRDVLGLASPQWVDASELAEFWKIRAGFFPERFHSYVSGDPSTRVSGTPFLARARTDVAASLESISRAVCIATRKSLHSHLKQVRGRSNCSVRSLTINLGHQLGMQNRIKLAEFTKTKVQTVSRILNTPLTSVESQTLIVARTILADQRLLRVRE